MPSRLLTESVCYSEKIEKLNTFAEVFFYRLLVNVDDYGRLDARPRMLRAKLFPLKNVMLGLMSDALRALEAAGLIDCYDVGGEPYLQIRDWETHQQIRFKREKYPPPPGWQNATSAGEARPFSGSAGAHAGAVESESHVISESESLSEVKKDAPAGPPSREEVREYAKSIGYGTDTDKFFDFYEATGWRNNKGRPVVWRAALATWERNEALWHGERKGAVRDPAARSFDPDDFFEAAVRRAYGTGGGA